MALPTALLDANVLYPAGLQDFLLRLADQYLYAPRWSVDIHAEWIRSVLADRPDLTAKHPDVFIAELFVADPEAVLAAVRGHRAALRNPPRTANEHVDALERLGLIRTASLVRPHRNSI